MALFGQKNDTVRSKPTTFTGAIVAEESNSVIGKSLTIKGEIFLDEEVLIEGTIEGNVYSKHRVIVGRSGVVNADVEAHEVIIKGTVNGNVKGQSKVEVIPEGVLNGNIISHRVVLKEGAIFKGNIDMTPDEKKDQAPVTEVLDAKN